jgi:hypothetical protein
MSLVTSVDLMAYSMLNISPRQPVACSGMPSFLLVKKIFRGEEDITYSFVDFIPNNCLT